MERDYVIEHIKTLIETVEEQRVTSLAEEYVNYEEVATLNKIILESCELLAGLGVEQDQYNDLLEETSALRVRCSEQEVMLERANQSASDWARRHHEIAHKFNEQTESKGPAYGNYDVGYWKEQAVKARGHVSELEEQLKEKQHELSELAEKVVTKNTTLQQKDTEIARLRAILSAVGTDPDKEEE